MVVLLIIAVVIGMTIPRLGKSLGSQMKTITRKIVVLDKELHHFARLRNKTYRLVLDFGNKDNKKAPKIYVESASTRQLLAPPEATPTPRPFGSDKAPPPVFTSDKEFLKKPIELPGGVIFEDVESSAYPKPVTEGQAFVHFFPEGLVQETIIHLTDGKDMHWSLVINPLTADTEVLTTYKKLKDIQP
jgi:hypothetical protein